MAPDGTAVETDGSRRRPGKSSAVALPGPCAATRGNALLTPLGETSERLYSTDEFRRRPAGRAARRFPDDAEDQGAVDRGPVVPDLLRPDRRARLRAEPRCPVRERGRPPRLHRGDQAGPPRPGDERHRRQPRRDGAQRGRVPGHREPGRRHRRRRGRRDPRPVRRPRAEPVAARRDHRRDRQGHVRLAAHRAARVVRLAMAQRRDLGRLRGSSRRPHHLLGHQERRLPEDPVRPRPDAARRSGRAGADAAGRRATVPGLRGLRQRFGRGVRLLGAAGLPHRRDRRRPAGDRRHRVPHVRGQGHRGDRRGRGRRLPAGQHAGRRRRRDPHQPLGRRRRQGARLHGGAGAEGRPGRRQGRLHARRRPAVRIVAGGLRAARRRQLHRRRPDRGQGAGGGRRDAHRHDRAGGGGGGGAGRPDHPARQPPDRTDPGHGDRRPPACRQRPGRRGARPAAQGRDRRHRQGGPGVQGKRPAHAAHGGRAGRDGSPGRGREAPRHGRTGGAVRAVGRRPRPDPGQPCRRGAAPGRGDEPGNRRGAVGGVGRRRVVGTVEQQRPGGVGGGRGTGGDGARRSASR